MSQEPKIYVAGHRGMVVLAIVCHLWAHGAQPNQIITRTHADLDLIHPAAVNVFFAADKPTRT